MLRPFGVLLELHDIRRFPMSLFAWILDKYFSAPDVDLHFYWRERGCLLSPTPDVIMSYACYPLYFSSIFFNMSRLMGAMSIEWSETRVEASSSDIPVAKNVAISWTPDYMLSLWCFNGNINYSQYFQSCTRSSLTSEFYIELRFYIFPLLIFWKRLDPRQNLWDLWQVSPNNSSISLYLYWSFKPHKYQCLILSLQAQRNLGTIGQR